MAGSHAARMGPADHVDVRIFAKSQYNPKICESRHHKRGSTDAKSQRPAGPTERAERPVHYLVLVALR